MRILEDASLDEKAELARAEEKLQKECGFAAGFGLSHLVEAWSRTVQQVEDGYDLSLYDFTHDLDLRDELEEIRAGLTRRLQRALSRLLEPLDTRFFEATQQTAEPLLPSAAGETLATWWSRVPLVVRPLPEDDSWRGLVRHQLVREVK